MTFISTPQQFSVETATIALSTAAPATQVIPTFESVGPVLVESFYARVISEITSGGSATLGLRIFNDITSGAGSTDRPITVAPGSPAVVPIRQNAQSATLDAGSGPFFLLANFGATYFYTPLSGAVPVDFRFYIENAFLTVQSTVGVAALTGGSVRFRAVYRPMATGAFMRAA